ncbi:MAG: hypothetical protein WBD00_00600 [Candidatus Omnitrophota bacterium]
MENEPAGLSRGRLVTGVIIFILGQATTLLIPFVTASRLTATWKTMLSGVLFFVTPQVGIVLAVAILGKTGYDYIRDIVLRWFKKYGPPETVSLARYRIGLTMFVLPLFFGWIEPYCSYLFSGFEAKKMIFFVTGDVMFIASFFVLGGRFWDKVRSLFVYESRAKFP